MRLLTCVAYLTAALIVAPAGDVWAQATTETASAQTERERQSKRTPRTSRRIRSATVRPFDEPRAERDAGPTRQELTFTSNLLGGYDDNVAGATGSGSGGSSAVLANGSTGYFDTGLGYFRGNALRSIEVNATGDLRAYPDYLKRPAVGARVGINGRTAVGRTWTVSASQRAAYEPLFSAFLLGAQSGELPAAVGETVPETGLYERRSLNSDSSAGIDRTWSRRLSTSLAYSYRVQQFTDDEQGDHRSHEVRAGHRWTLASRLRAWSDYRYANSETTDYRGLIRPFREHRLEVGPEIAAVFSRRRHLTLSLGAGASHIESITSIAREPYRSWVPVGSGRAMLALSPSWSVESGYRRDVSRLQGITDEAYTTDTAFLSTHALLTDRIDARAGATYSHWRTPDASGVDGRFTVYGGSLEIGVALTRNIAATAGYFYYRHEYSNPAQLRLGFPAEFDRHAVRVGLALWIPLLGHPATQQLVPR